MSRRNALVATVAGLATVGLVLGVRAAVGTGDDRAAVRALTSASGTTTVTASTTTAATGARTGGGSAGIDYSGSDYVDHVDADAVPDLAAADLATARTMGWDITIETSVDRLDETQLAARRLAVRGMHTHVVGLSLARVTIHGYGTPVDPDVEPRGDEGLTLLVENKLFWVAVARHVPSPGRGPSRSPAPPPITGYSDVIMLVDPATSRTSIARTLSADS